MRSILIVYSNPSNTARIRLDKEHRAVDKVIEDLGLEPDTIIWKHAVSIEDLTSALTKFDLEVVHLSGHGSEEGFYLEHSSRDEGRYS